MSTKKTTQEILEKLGIEQLNPMQLSANKAILTSNEIVLLSPTGTGKTIAFLLPIIELLDPNNTEVQVLIIVPSRELAIQIENVLREMGTGYKTNAIYGGRSGSKDKVEIKTLPTLLIGTPGRIADTFRKELVDPSTIKTLVLDEYDKSLEIGFEVELKEIMNALTHLNKKILTSATQATPIPDFVELKKPVRVDFSSKETVAGLSIKTVEQTSNNRLQTLGNTLRQLENQPGIIFCNFKDTIQTVSEFLDKNNMPHSTFFGGMEQVDRERALIKFRNGTHKLLLATDLAARGIDIPELKFIIHYQLPIKLEEFTHRNGRTARMHANGTAYVIIDPKERIPEYFQHIETTLFTTAKTPTTENLPVLNFQTLYVTGGRKDKISKGDIVGLFMKQGGLTNEELGAIEIKTDCSFVAVATSKVPFILENLNNVKLKTKKVRISIVK
jgi:superfamily II DNA/RNA helicase